jgi:HK97 family phage prohead protease
MVTILAVPYDVDTPIYRHGEWITESVSPGAFAGVEHRARQVKVNRGHDIERSCGVARALHPDDPRGLVADLRISETPLGDETLALVADGVLDASVGFAPMGPAGEVWSEHRQRRRVVKGYLGHIALVPNPAYDTTHVIDVRAAAAPTTASMSLPGSDTPRLNEVLARLAEIGYVPRQVEPH